MTDYNTSEYWQRLASNNQLDDHSTLAGTEGDRFVDIEESLHFKVYGARIVDVAAGYGRFTIPLAKKFEVVAVDLSASMLDRLLNNASSYGLKEKIAVVCADMRFLPFKQASFDGLICFAAFYCVPKEYWQNTLQLFSNLLASDGWILLTLKQWRCAFKAHFGFGLFYLAAYIALKLESRSSIAASLSRKYGLHGRTEYLVTQKRAKELLSACFSQVESRDCFTVKYYCSRPKR